MTRNEVRIGLRVKSNRDFCAVPKGTDGVLDEDYGDGVMIAWDLPDSPLPFGYSEYDGVPATRSGILRDGFDNEELKFLDIAEKGSDEK